MWTMFRNSSKITATSAAAAAAAAANRRRDYMNFDVQSMAFYIYGLEYNAISLYCLGTMCWWDWLHKLHNTHTHTQRRVRILLVQKVTLHSFACCHWLRPNRAHCIPCVYVCVSVAGGASSVVCANALLCHHSLSLSLNTLCVVCVFFRLADSFVSC